MKKYLVPVLACVLLLLSFFQLFALRNDVKLLTRGQDSLSNRVNEQGSSIANQVHNALSTQASLLHRFETSYGELDSAALSVPTRITAQPKELHADSKLSLLGGTASQPFTRQGDTFVLDLNLALPITDAPDVEWSLCLESGGVKQLESLPMSLDVSHFLLIISATCYGTVSSKGEDILYQGSIDMYLPSTREGVGFDSFTDFKFLSTENGQVIFEKSYSDEAVKRRDPNSNSYTLQLNERIAKSTDQSQELWLQTTDSYGLRHQLLLSNVFFGASSTPIPDLSPLEGVDFLYRADGSLLYASNRSISPVPPLYGTASSNEAACETP